MRAPHDQRGDERELTDSRKASVCAVQLGRRLALPRQRLECGDESRALRESSLVASQVQCRRSLPGLESLSPSPLPSPLGRGNSRRPPVQDRRRISLSPLSGCPQNRTKDHPAASARSTTGEWFSLSLRERAGVRGTKTNEGHESFGHRNACKAQTEAPLSDEGAEVGDRADSARVRPRQSGDKSPHSKRFAWTNDGERSTLLAAYGREECAFKMDADAMRRSCLRHARIGLACAAVLWLGNQ
jgi:hypothetical protein